ncbi:MAG: hypothetical protein RRZ84_01920 [Romboutsia sp.]
MFKNIFSYLFSILAITTILLLFSNTQPLNNNLICNAEPISNHDLKDENTQLKYQIESLEGTIKMLKDALDELGATTPNEAMNIWAKGIKTRNGYLQYYVLCDGMKNEFKKELYKAQHTSWVTGYSSPWVSSYNIINIEKINSVKYKFTINFNWATSMGPYDSTKVTITTTKIDNKWCISNILWSDTMKKLIF